MYRHCIFCVTDLGRNEAIESFPVGRRLAFDAGRGRLWVVCRACGRWNLTPLEERWEAVEACEALFRRMAARASTEHVGIARTQDGLDLIRVGSPLRPEFAAWRYGDTFRRRRDRILLAGASTAAGVVGFAIGSPLLASAIVAWPASRLLARVARATVSPPPRVVSNMGETIQVSRLDLGGRRCTPIDPSRRAPPTLSRPPLPPQISRTGRPSQMPWSISRPTARVPSGVDALRAVWAANIGERMALVVDGRVRSAPAIASAVGSPMQAALDVPGSDIDRLVSLIRARWP